MFKKIAALATAGVLALTLTGCEDDATVVSHNLSKDADNFKIERRIVFYNGITDEYMLTIEGLCSQVSVDGRLEVTCKVGPNEYKKHFLGLSDNVTYVSEQLESADVSEYHYKVIFKPETILPNIEVNSSFTDDE